jgi:hypothetical protein
MGQVSHLTAPVLERYLLQAKLTGAQASLRLEGPQARILGDLHILGIRPGVSLGIAGLHTRDSVPALGTPVTLSVLLGEEILTLRSTLLPAEPAAGLSSLQLAWPELPAQVYPRRDMRVAAPAQKPLKAKVGLENRSLDALLVNLTESGVGLAFRESLLVDLHTAVQIDAELPDGASLHCPGEVRHLSFLEGQAFPTRLGVILHPTPTTDLGPMLRFIQARRTDRSQSLRKS